MELHNLSAKTEPATDRGDVNLESVTNPQPDSNSNTIQGEHGAETIYPTGTKLWLSLLALGFVVVLGGIDFSILGVAVPSITQHFNSFSDVGWYTVAYRLTACAFQFGFGQLYDMFPCRRVLLGSILFFLVGSALSAAAFSSTMFIVGRAITGVGSAGVLGGCFTALIATSPLRIRPILTSLFSALESVAMIVAPIVGGTLTKNVSWRWCSYISLPVGGLALVLMTLFLTESTSTSSHRAMPWREILKKLDLASNFLFVVSMASLFMALSWAGTKFAWSSAQVVVLLVVFAVCLGLFGYNQYKRGDTATLSPRILRQRSIISGVLFSMCLNGVLGMLEYYLPIYYQLVHQFSPEKAGYMLLPITLGFTIALVFQGSVTSVMGYYTPFMILSSIIMPIGAGLVSTWTADSGYPLLIISSALVGVGAGMAFEVPQICVQAVLSDADGPLGLSVTLFAQNFGGALFISIAQQVFTSQILKNLHGKVPNLTPTSIQSLGLYDLYPSASDDQAQAILDGLDQSFKQIWYFAIALSCASLIGSLSMEWRSVKEHTE